MKTKETLLSRLDDLIHSYTARYNKFPDSISANNETINKIEKALKKQLIVIKSIPYYHNNIFHYRGIQCIPNKKEPFIKLI